MDNIIFDDNIKVSVLQSPVNPIVGDEVVFTANVIFSRPSDNYSIPNTYFFSYTWLASNDGGDTFYQVGNDTEELVITNIDTNFFNTIYKVQVALIDLDNIILTEAGDNLATQFGEILLKPNNNSTLSIQATNNTSSTSNISPTSNNTDLIGLEIANLETVVTEAAAFDTTVNEENTAEVLSGQVTIDKTQNNQTIDGSPLVLVPAEELPDPTIETDLNQQSILSGTKFFKYTKELNMACDTKLSYQVCKGGATGPYETLQDCLDAGGCSDDDMITITKFDIAKNKLGDSIGYSKNYLIGPPDQGGIYLIERIKSYCCNSNNLVEWCPLEKKTGDGTCENKNSTKDAYIPSKNDPKCKECFEIIDRTKEIGITIDPSEITDDCGCNPPNAKIKDSPIRAEIGRVVDSPQQAEVEIVFKCDTFDALIQTDQATGITNTSETNIAGIGSFIHWLLYSTEIVQKEVWVDATPQHLRNLPGHGFHKIVKTWVPRVVPRISFSAIGTGLRYVGQGILARIAAGTVLAISAEIGVVAAVGYGAYYVVSNLTTQWLTPTGGVTSREPVRQMQCTDTIFKRVYKCLDDQYSDPKDPAQYYKCDVKYTIAGDLYEDEQIISQLNYTPTYTCNCLRANGEQYQGSVTVKRWTTGDLQAEGLSVDQIRALNLQCQLYITEVTGKPGSTCECTTPDPIDVLADQGMSSALCAVVSQSGAVNVDRVYKYYIPAFNPDKFNVVRQDIRDCMQATGDCMSDCDGFYCCDSKKDFVYELVGVGSSSFVCNIGKNVLPPNDCPGASTVTFDKCNDISTKTINISLYKIIKRLRNCNEITDNDSVFVDEEWAVWKVKNAVKEGVGLIYHYEEKDSSDPADKTVIAPVQLASDGKTVLVPELTKHSKYEFKSPQTVSNTDNICDLCKVLYSVSEGASDYPCNDRNIDTSQFCGWKAGCNIDNSSDETPFNIAIITQNANPSFSDLSKVNNDYTRNGFYDDFGKAMADATKIVGNRGIILSSPCPDP